jgi:endonuclease/exonuclease/phosphatase family metal-dependent hydrolase
MNWSVRNVALKSSLRATEPDILCVQEAIDEQVSELARELVGFEHVGVGRDDGRAAGEYCAIFFNRSRFDKLDSGTFWLEEPIDRPPATTLFGPKRICTWVRLVDKQTDRVFRLCNMHSYLSEHARLEAAKIVLSQIAVGDPADAVLVAGDFNSSPGAPNRLLFEQAGLRSSRRQSGEMQSAATNHFYGIRLSILDDVLAGAGWEIKTQRVLDVKPGNTFPSDHFGLMVDLNLRTARGVGGQPR